MLATIMIKKLIIILTLMNFHYSISQDFKKMKFERNYSNITMAQNSVLNYLAFNNKNSKHKIDSLKIIDRQNLLKKIFGKWKFVSSHCSDCVVLKNKKKTQLKKFIKITKNNISFYEKKLRKENIIQHEEFKFTEHFGHFSDLTNLLFSDKSIWSFQTDKSAKFLMIYYSGNETTDGRTTIASGMVFEYYKKLN